MDTNNPLGILAHCNLDQANWHLAQGSATKEQGAAFVEMWNRPGMRFTVARLASYTKPFGDTVMEVPVIKISEQP